MKRPTPEFLVSMGRISLVFVWIALLFLIATNIQAGWLYVIIAFFAMFLVVSIAYPLLSLRGLRAELHLPEFCEKGCPGPFRLTLENPSCRGRFLVRAVIDAPGAATFPPAFLAVWLPGRGRVSFGGDIVPERRGPLDVHRVRLTTAAPIGLFTASRIVRCASSCLVHPRILGERDRDAVESDIAAVAERFEIKSFTEDPYHYQLRDYTPGDSLRLIHWKQTARIGEPVVRIAERHPLAEQTLLVDDVATHYPPGDDEVFEMLLDRVATTAHHVVFTGNSRLTLLGLLAPPVTVELPNEWANALRWMALIRLQTPAGPVHAVRGAHLLFTVKEKVEKQGEGERV